MRTADFVGGERRFSGGRRGGNGQGSRRVRLSAKKDGFKRSSGLLGKEEDGDYIHKGRCVAFEVVRVDECLLSHGRREEVRKGLVSNEWGSMRQKRSKAFSDRASSDCGLEPKTDKGRLVGGLSCVTAAHNPGGGPTRRLA